MTKEQFRALVIRAFGYCQTYDGYAAKLGLSYHAFSHAWNGHSIPKTVEDRVRSTLGGRFILGDEATRPMIIGINDYHAPSAVKPYWPSSGLGRRMWFLLYQEVGMSRAEYLLSFDRVALIFIPQHHSATKKEALWRSLAYAKGQELRPHLANRTAILLDEGLMRMLSLRHTEKYLQWFVEPDGFKWCRAPRRPPMGQWKEPETNARMREQLLKIYIDWLSMPR